MGMIPRPLIEPGATFRGHLKMHRVGFTPHNTGRMLLNPAAFEVIPYQDDRTGLNECFARNRQTMIDFMTTSGSTSLRSARLMHNCAFALFFIVIKQSAQRLLCRQSWNIGTISKADRSVGCDRFKSTRKPSFLI